MSSVTNNDVCFHSWKINTECELDAIDQSGCTPLHHACINAPDGHRSVKVGIYISS